MIISLNLLNISTFLFFIIELMAFANLLFRLYHKRFMAAKLCSCTSIGVTTMTNSQITNFRQREADTGVGRLTEIQ